jgi:sulfonate transport system permease protein
VIGAEFFMSVAPGIGGILTAGRATMRMEVVLVAIGLTGGVGLLLNLVVFGLEQIFLRWRPTAGEQ